MEFKKDIKNGVIYILIFFVGCLTMYGVFRYFPVSVTENITKTEKDVTVTDKGIADAVEKVYDSVLVVSTYKSNKMISAGTGFIYKKDNNKYYILTNYHVIESGDKVNVTFTDGEIIETTIVGYDQYADIAILSFESKKNITIASLGKSEETRVGDTTFAVGAPLDSAYSWTVTRGIVSGKDRMVEVTIGSSHNNDYVMKVLQTDSAINSGNSGGPLCNSNGEVIGITSLKLVSDGIEGMGFAIPIETALAKAENIISGKVVNNPYIGVAMLDLSTAYYYQQFNDLIKKSNVTAGVIISDVEKDGSAEKAGIKPGDIIVKINNDEVKNIAYLRYNLYKYNVGDTINVVLFRDGKEMTLPVKLASSSKTS